MLRDLCGEHSRYSDKSTGLQDLGFDSRKGQHIFFFFSKTPRPALRPNQPTIQWREDQCSFVEG
jgi:hypothetical protein